MPLEATAAISASEPALVGKVISKVIEWTDQGGLRAMRDVAVKGDGTLKQQPGSLEAKADQLAAGADALDVRGLNVSASTGEGGATIDRPTAPRLEASSSRAAGERIELAVARRGTEPADAKVLIEGVSGTAARLEATTVKITGTTRSAQRSTRFDATTALVANVNDRTLRFDRAGGDVVIEDAAFGPKPVRLPLSGSGTSTAGAKPSRCSSKRAARD